MQHVLTNETYWQTDIPENITYIICIQFCNFVFVLSFVYVKFFVKPLTRDSYEPKQSKL